MRDDFSPATRRLLAARAGHRCSHPDCRAPTSGASSDSGAAVDLGIGAHITAAAPGGPRYDPQLTPEGRAEATNGIWLCRVCAALIDADTSRFTVALLQEWKGNAEAEAQVTVGRAIPQQPTSASVSDRDLFEDFQRTLPYEGSIGFVDRTNMAGFAFDPERLIDLERFAHEWGDAAHEFLDSDIESKRRYLHTLARSYLIYLSVNTWPTHNGRQIVPPEWEETDPDRFHEVVGRLHALAGGIVAGHQDLIRTARRRLQL